MYDTDGDPREEPRYQEGRYGNYFRVGYNAFEFLLVFGQSYADGEQETLHTRIVTTPSYAKAFVELLQSSLAEYEDKYGPIPGHESGHESERGVNDHVDE